MRRRPRSALIPYTALCRASDGPVAVSKDGDYETPHGASPSAAGSYYWVASYSGDANNKAASSGCADEPITVGQASPGIETTQLPAAATVGANFKVGTAPCRVRG